MGEERHSKLFVAAAGAGKTTFLINQASDLLGGANLCGKRIAFITYTQKNQNDVIRKLTKRFGYVPNQIYVLGWFTFLLQYCIRPFMGSVINDLRCQDVGVYLVNETSGIKKNKSTYYYTYKRDDLSGKYLTSSNKIYSDKLSEFAYQCYEKNKKEFTERLSNIFYGVYIDEMQDLDAWDYEIMKILVKDCHLHQVLICGDPRQKTFSTTPSTKHGKYKGRLDLFFENEVNTKRNRFVEIDATSLSVSHRFGTEIAKISSMVTGDTFPTTTPCGCKECMEKQMKFKDMGVFLVRNGDVVSFVERYNPMVLIWDKKHNNHVSDYTFNYGEAKGSTVNVCLIYPTKSILKNFLEVSENSLPDLTRSKLYVALTRARCIVAIVVDDNFDKNVHKIRFWTSR